MSDRSNSNDNQNNQQPGQYDPQANRSNVKPYEQQREQYSSTNQSQSYEPYQSQSNSSSFDQQPFGQPNSQQQQYMQQQPQYSQQQPQQNQGGYYNQPPQYGYPNYQQPGMPPHLTYIPVKTNTKAIVGLVLGICALIIPYLGFLIGIAGIIVNALGLKEIPRKQEAGKGLAIAGLVCSIAGVFLYTVIILFLIIAFAAFSDNSYYY